MNRFETEPNVWYLADDEYFWWFRGNLIDKSGQYLMAEILLWQ